MDEVERITVSLPLTDELREAVETGEYPNPEAAIVEAIEAWSADRWVARIGVERLRRHWDEGIASGDFQPIDVEDILLRIKAEARVPEGDDGPCS